MKLNRSQVHGDVSDTESKKKQNKKSAETVATNTAVVPQVKVGFLITNNSESGALLEGKLTCLMPPTASHP